MTPSAIFSGAIPSVWIGVADILTDLLAHATRILLSKTAEGFASESGKTLVKKIFDERKFSPHTLIKLRTHFVSLSRVTSELAIETRLGAGSAKYHELREQWLARYAPTHVVLHNLDPDTLSAIGIFSRKLAALLGQPLTVSEKTLSEALEAERAEIEYDTESHLCTLCLQRVRTWSESKTLAGGLNELAATLNDTLDTLDGFIRANWTFGEVA